MALVHPHRLAYFQCKNKKETKLVQIQITRGSPPEEVIFRFIEGPQACLHLMPHPSNAQKNILMPPAQCKEIRVLL